MQDDPKPTQANGSAFAGPSNLKATQSQTLPPPPPIPAPSFPNLPTYPFATLQAFDLDAYASSYSSRALITRLHNISASIATTPESAPLKRDALLRAVKEVKENTTDAASYIGLVRELGKLKDVQGVGSNENGNGADAAAAGEGMDLDPAPSTSYSSSVPLSTSFPPPSSELGLSSLSSEVQGIQDEVWVRSTRLNAQKEKDKLDVEMKNYGVNLIKESIRLTHHALANHQRQTGDYQAALKTYGKSREFNSNAAHELETSMSIVEVALELKYYYQASPAIVKAEYALNRLASSIKPSAAGATGAASSHVLTGAQERVLNEKQREMDENQAKTTVKLKVARGIVSLAQGNWEAAARELAGVSGNLEDWEGKIISSSDVAIYASLCALASMSRSAIKTNILDNSQMRTFIDHGHAGFVKDLVAFFVEAKYENMLSILNLNKLRFDIDPHLAPEVSKLFRAIRHRAYLQYFQPFNAVQLQRMSAAFGYKTDREFMDMTSELIGLIEKGRLDARLDTIDNVLYAVKIDHRKQVFSNAFKTGASIETTTQKTMIRLKLIEADLFVETRKEREDRLENKRKGGSGYSKGAAMSAGGDSDMEAAIAMSLKEQ